MFSQRPEKLRGYRLADASLLARVSAPLRADFLRFLLRRQPVKRHIVTDVKVPHFGGSERVFGMEPGTVTDVGALHFLGAGKNPRNAKRFEYVTTDSHGRQLTATGALIRSEKPWSGTTRPVIGFAPSTQGVAQHCDPSHSSAIGFKIFREEPKDVIMAYELPVMLAFLRQGCDVVFIDYPRDPDAHIQYYVDHIAAGQSLYDALRAARTLGISEDQPIGLWGFSQGGGAVGWCAQNPVLPVRAAVVGAPPSTLEEVMKHVDGSLVVGTLAYSVAGLMVETPELWEQLWPLFNEHGRKKILANITTCAGGTVFASGYERTRDWTVDGRSFAQVVASLPAVTAALRRQELGHSAPTIPTRLWGSRNDDVIPVQQVRALRDRWLELDGEVSYVESRLPRLPGRTGANHFLPYYLSVPQQMEWLLERLR
ncbi:putative inactive lipase [Corynebacterium kalinowskii]|uniref:Inactive lipase n=1 Tax=Corynebacterium kalinowskii TaxID=2675216 RepID=A0A6B8VKG9_9CORY|nr:lipase family protein [Corynebacterium kalinowskii]QGU01974.1 putative inactive lipase [Corynebacterium kalinowskii]